MACTGHLIVLETGALKSLKSMGVSAVSLRVFGKATGMFKAQNTKAPKKPSAVSRQVSASNKAQSPAIVVCS
jgi:hypothetical protein